jgi:hypothetical protein
LQNSFTQTSRTDFAYLLLVRDGFPNRPNGKKHRRGIAVESALAHAL